jgi:hypothetical protein
MNISWLQRLAREWLSPFFFIDTTHSPVFPSHSSTSNQVDAWKRMNYSWRTFVADPCHFTQVSFWLSLRIPFIWRKLFRYHNTISLLPVTVFFCSLLRNWKPMSFGSLYNVDQLQFASSLSELRFCNLFPQVNGLFWKRKACGFLRFAF